MKKLITPIFSFALILLFWSTLDNKRPAKIVIENTTMLVQFVPDVLSE